MPLSEMAIAAAAVLTGVKAYRRHRRKQSVNRFLILDRTGILRPEDEPLTSAVEEVKDTLN